MKNRRSPFLLESDAASRRLWSVEANKAFTYLCWQRFVIIAGVSFACPTDRGLLNALATVEEDLPIGAAHWIVVNFSDVELRQIEDLLRRRFPRATVELVQNDFGNWVSTGCNELRAHGVLV